MTGHRPEPVEAVHVTPPDLNRLDSRDFTLSYDESTDTMFLYFIAGELHPVSVLVDADNDVYALVDAESGAAVGIQLEGYLERAVYTWPELLALGLWAGVPAERLEPAIHDVTDRSTVPDARREAQRRVFDLSIKERINRLFHAPGDPPAVATA